MAVDSRSKRFGMMGFGVPEPNGLLFDADGSVDDDDRVYLLGLYGGLDVEEASQVNTRQKRFAMMSFGVPFQCAAIMFEADGAVDADDRAHMLYLYDWFTGTGDLERFQTATMVKVLELAEGDYLEVWAKRIEGSSVFHAIEGSGVGISGPIG